MHKRIAALFFVLGLLTAPLWAGRVDVVNRDAAAGTGSSTVFSKRLTPPGDLRLSVDVETRFNAATETYTYIFTLHSNQASTPLDKFNLFLDKKAVSPSLAWGVIQSETTQGVGLQGITWGQMLAKLNDGGPGGSGVGLDAGESITFYVQSKVPPSMAFEVEGNQWHEPTPEPATLLLFGTSLLLAFALLRRKVAFRS